MQETWVQSLGQEDPLERKWQPTPGFLPGKSHGQRSLVGYSLQGYRRVGPDLETKTTSTDVLMDCTFPVMYALPTRLSKLC